MKEYASPARLRKTVSAHAKECAIFSLMIVTAVYFLAIALLPDVPFGQYIKIKLASLLAFASQNDLKWLSAIDSHYKTKIIFYISISIGAFFGVWMYKVLRRQQQNPAVKSGGSINSRNAVSQLRRM